MNISFVLAFSAYFAFSLLLYSVLFHVVSGIWTERKLSKDFVMALIWSVLGFGVLAIQEFSNNDMYAGVFGLLVFFLLVLFSAKVYELSLPKSFSLMGLSWGIAFGMGIALYFPLVSFFPLYQQIGSSMEPSFPDSERMVFYDSRNIERGDIIVFHPSFSSDEFYLKRVIGLPGEKVILRSGSVFINDQKLTEPYLAENSITCSRAALRECPNDDFLYQVPEQSYFVLGDNRERSSDSRAWFDQENKPLPFVEEKQIMGKMIFSLTSPSMVVDRPTLGSIPKVPADLDVRMEELIVSETPISPEDLVEEKIIPDIPVVNSETPSETPPKSHENWDHVAKSLTQYLIMSGETMAMVENCPAGYEKMYPNKDIYTCKDFWFENRWLHFEWLDGRVVRAPDDLSYHFLLDFQNPGGSSLQYRMTSDQNTMIYLDTWSDDESRVVAYDIASASKNTLMSFLPVKEDSCNGIRFFGWNPNETKLGIVVGNEGVYGSYPNITKVFILTIEDEKLSKKSNYPLPVVADCTPNNGPFFAVDWVDDDTIGYYDPNDNPYNDHTKDDYDPEYLETFFWGDDRWGSKYVKYRDVD